MASGVQLLLAVVCFGLAWIMPAPFGPALLVCAAVLLVGGLVVATINDRANDIVRRLPAPPGEAADPARKGPYSEDLIA